MVVENGQTFVGRDLRKARRTGTALSRECRSGKRHSICTGKKLDREQDSLGESHPGQPRGTCASSGEYSFQTELIKTVLLQDDPEALCGLTWGRETSSKAIAQ